MTLFLTVLHVMVCIMLIVIVLVQRGKGAEIGAVFGGGASSTVFGSRGAGNFLTKLTTGGAIVFMVTSLWLSYIATSGATRSIFEEEEARPPAAASGAQEEGSPFIEVEPAPPAEGAPAEAAAPAGAPAAGEAPPPAPAAAPESAPPGAAP